MMSTDNNKNKVNFSEGIVPPDHLIDLKVINQDIGFIINNFKEVRPSRFPVLIAEIIDAENEQLETVFYFDKLKKVLDRANSRPIICVSCLGRYQSGKSSTLAGLTGNWAHISGDGVEEKTKGVYIDGPYELEDLYQRFSIKPSDDLFFINNEDLTPVIFFFDIEGYGGKIHGIIRDANNKAFVKLCTPFLCISSAFYLMSVSAPDIDEVKKMVNVMQISNLTIKSQVKGNGEIKIIIGITNYSNLIKYKEDISNNKIVLKAIEKAKTKLEKHWYGIDQFRECGIVSDFVPMVSPSAHEVFLITFEYFAQNIIKSIENASQGNYMRSVDETIALFQYIVDHYLDPNFKNDIKIKITEGHDNTMRAIAYKTMKECVSKYNKEFDDLIQSFEKDYHIDHELLPILEEFKNNTKEMMLNKVNVISESPEVSVYMNQAVELVSKHIREKYDIYLKEKNKFLVIEEMKVAEHAKQFENMKKCVQKFINLAIVKKIYKAKKQIVQKLRHDLLKKNYYLEYYKNTDVFVHKIFDQFNRNIKQNELIANIQNRFQQNKNVDHELFNEVLDYYKDENNFKSIVDQVVADIRNQIKISICTEFDEARLELSECFDEFKKEKVRVLLLFTIVNTYKRTKTIFPDNSYHVTEYILIKSKKSFLTYDES